MSIEKSPNPGSASHAASSPKAGAPSQAARGKAAAADAKPDAPGSGGFMAILGALEDGPAEQGAGAAADAAAPAQTLTAAPAELPNTLAFDASTLLQQNPQIAAAQALQAAADAAGAASAAAGASAQSSQGTQAFASAKPAAGRAAGDAAGLALQAAAPGTAALLPAAGAGATASAPDADAPAAAARGRPGDSAAARAAGLASADGSGGNGGGGAAQENTQALTPGSTAGWQQAAAHAKAGKEALAWAAGSGTDSSTGANGTSSATGANGSSTAAERLGANPFLAAIEQARAPQTAAALEPVLAPLMAKAEKSASERSGLDAKGADPTYSGTALGVSATDFSPSAAALPTLAPELQVAEQVSYWVSHNVQNAELKLDGLGQLPVEVSISLQGNEAQISFRTDEAATRDVLQSAGAHLKDLLQREGLVLTGVSVGSSGSGNADARARQGRPTPRQTAIAPLQVASSDSAPRLRGARVGSAGRSVDLFV